MLRTNGQDPATAAADSPYWFDKIAADRSVAFFPSFLRLTVGEFFNRPFVLSPWQEHDIIRQLFGWKRKSDGTRRYRRCYVWIARKNGKSELAAGVAHLALLADGEPGGQVYSIATDKSQAEIVFNKASEMLQLSATLQPHMIAFKDSIYCPELGASFKPLAGRPKGKHGLNASGIIGDEVHEWTSDKLYTFVHQSTGGRRQPIEFMISTAGEMNGYGFEAYRMCESILDGTIDDPDTLVVIYGADPEKDRKDPDYWKSDEAVRAANPNYGISPKVEYIEAERKKATQLPRLENDYKRYHLNLWVEQATRWLPMDAWADCGQDPVLRNELAAAAKEDRPVSDLVHRLLRKPDQNERWRYLAKKMEGRKAYGGVDLSTTTDLTCLAWVFPPEGDDILWTVVPHFYCPEVGIKRRAHVDKVPYEHWAKIGALTPTPGNAVDYSYVKARALSDAEEFDVKTIAVDRWNAVQFSIQLNAEGLETVLFGQGFASMSAPAKFLETLLLERLLDHGGHPVLSWCARNVAVSRDAADNIKPDKAKSTERIDGVVALVEGIGVANAAPKEPDLSDFLSNPVMTS
jgi:phage terminase large subunit-like protein